jgi:flagellar basal-body rod protein FlgC
MPGPVGLLPLLTNATEPRPPMFRPLGISAGGLSAQRLRMETIATNIANAETTRGPTGVPYRRRVVRLEEAAAQPMPGQYPPLPSTQQRGGVVEPDPTSGLGGVQVVAVEEDQSEGPLVYDPGHPDANAQGYVRYPNVRVTDEMVDLMEARRVYEANATVFEAAKQLLRRALSI